MPVEIVVLHPNEWPLYRAIRLESLQIEPQAFGSTYAKTLELPDEEWANRLGSTRNHPRFARLDGEIVALAGIALERDKRSASIFGAYVRPSHRGQGIGKRLMESLLQIARAEPGIDQIVLCVNAAQPAAIALYRSCGFSETRRTEDILGDGANCEVVHMERPAGNP
jgi:ribosomal protein S18 acetylase RimI-like enzyme